VPLILLMIEYLFYETKDANYLGRDFFPLNFDESADLVLGVKEKRRMEWKENTLECHC
jgi:hypothetical protein